MDWVPIMVAILHLGFWALVLGAGINRALRNRGDSDRRIVPAIEIYS